MLLFDITSSLFWWPKWPLNKGSLSLTLRCSMLPLRGTDGVINMHLWYYHWMVHYNHGNSYSTWPRTYLRFHFSFTASKQHKLLPWNVLWFVINQCNQAENPPPNLRGAACEGHFSEISPVSDLLTQRVLEVEDRRGGGGGCIGLQQGCLLYLMWATTCSPGVRHTFLQRVGLVNVIIQRRTLHTNIHKHVACSLFSSYSTKVPPLFIL